ncbi:MAG: glycosyltransferase [Armatimonadota bacterium]
MRNSMRIGIFTEAYTPIVSGVVTSTKLLLAEFRRRGHDAQLYTPRYPGWNNDEPGVARFPSAAFPVRSWIPVTLPYSRRLLREIREAGLEVYHTQQPFIMGRLARHLARRYGAPLICTVHTQYEHYVHYVTPTAHRAARAVTRALIRSFCNTCDVLTTPAKGMEQLLRSYGVTRPIHVIPNGLELEPYRSAEPHLVRRRFSVPDDAVLFLFLGRLAKEKNLTALLGAMQILVGSGYNAVAMLVGDGPERGPLEEAAQRMGIAHRVVFTGRVPHLETPAYHAAADVFVMPSVTEVNPYGVIEALAARKPVVATDSFGMREILTHEVDSLLVPPDAESLAEAMARLAADPELRRSMSASASVKAEQFAIPRCADRFLEVYQSALEQRRG